MEPSESRPPSLLIVDDDVGFVHAAAELARMSGFDITVAGELSQAMHRVKQRDFDLALARVPQAAREGGTRGIAHHFSGK